MTPGSDLDRGLTLARWLAADVDPDALVWLTVEGPPASKSRPVVTRRGTFTPAKTRNAERHLADQLRPLFPEPMTGNVFLGCIFFRPDRQRIDTDNMLKLVCDAANGLVFHDDSQVTAVAGITEFDPDHPRTVIVIGPHVSTMKRGTDATLTCAVCGTTFPMPLGARASMRKTCSRECAARARGFHPLDEPIPCAQCAKPFRRTTTAQRMCSPECRAAALRGRNKASAPPLSRCADCDVELTHRRGGRCRSCWRASRARKDVA